MIYCFKKMRELRLTHLFFLHYALALLIGGAAIAGLFVLGGGLQFYSVVVLCYMYTQPTFLLLRRMKMYEVRQEIKYGDYSPCEKILLAENSSLFRPVLDEDFVINTISITLDSMILFLENEILFICEVENCNGYPVAALMSVVFALLTLLVQCAMINEMKE